MRSDLRDLVERLQEVARSHKAFGQAADVIDNMADHLCARARAEEINAALVDDDAKAHANKVEE